jgi:hypothetical protein
MACRGEGDFSQPFSVRLQQEGYDFSDAGNTMLRRGEAMETVMPQ